MKIQWDTSKSPQTILKSVEPDLWHIDRPKIWYLPGAGGNWLNYLVWSYLNDRNIEGDHLNFHFDYLREIDPKYNYVLRCWFHTEPWHTGDLVFGSHKACLNIWINNCRKLGHTTSEAALTRMAIHYQNDYNWNTGYSIQWHLIVTDPEFLLACINDALGLSLSYTPVVQRSIKQYIASCWPTELQGDSWKDHYLTKAWVSALKYRGVPEEEVYNHWTPYYPDNESL